MTDLIDRIGPYVGVAAFLGLALLAFLVIQQAREVRRLREWAGRAPERARDATEAETALAEAKGEEVSAAEVEEPDPSRFGLWWQGVRDSVAAFAAEIDRRLPVDPRYILAVLAAGVVAAACTHQRLRHLRRRRRAQRRRRQGRPKPEKVEVAVLNATQVEDTVTGEPIAAVPGLAGLVAKKVVKPAGFKVARRPTPPSGLDETTDHVRARQRGRRDQAGARRSTNKLGETEDDSR